MIPVVRTVDFCPDDFLRHVPPFAGAEVDAEGCCAAQAAGVEVEGTRVQVREAEFLAFVRLLCTLRFGGDGIEDLREALRDADEEGADELGILHRAD